MATEAKIRSEIVELNEDVEALGQMGDYARKVVAPDALKRLSQFDAYADAPLVIEVYTNEIDAMHARIVEMRTRFATLGAQISAHWSSILQTGPPSPTSTEQLNALYLQRARDEPSQRLLETLQRSTRRLAVLMSQLAGELVAAQKSTRAKQTWRSSTISSRPTRAPRGYELSDSDEDEVHSRNYYLKRSELAQQQKIEARRRATQAEAEIMDD
jgi:hypothetical protein